MPTADLVALPVVSGTPQATPATFWVSNRTPVVRALRHPDAFNTLYLEFRFPAGCLSSLNGQPLTTDDSVLVTVSPRPGGYGFTLSPNGLVFTLASTPSVVVSYGRYADPSVADGVPTYPDRASYLAALEIWEEVTVDRWRVARGSSVTGVDELSAAVDAPGAFLVAARR